MPIRIKYTAKTSPTSKLIRDTLAETITTKRLKQDNSTWRGKPTDLLVNWGSTSPIRENIRAVTLNKPEAVAIAVDKLKTFSYLSNNGVNHPRYREVVNFTSDLEAIAEFIYNTIFDYDVDTVLLRTTSTGYGGAGIHVLDNLVNSILDYVGYDDADDIEVADVEYYLEYLYSIEPGYREIFNNLKFISQYFKGRDEYRIHVMMGQVIFSQRKALRTDSERPENPNFIVRNHANGFIFQSSNINVPEIVQHQAIKTVKALGLDFGAVDIKFDQGSNRAAVLEVNTAPGVTGKTLTAYVDAFSSIHDVIQNPEDVAVIPAAELPAQEEPYTGSVYWQHNPGFCPTNLPEIIEVQYRNGETAYTHLDNFRWNFSDSEYDVMYYRIPRT